MSENFLSGETLIAQWRTQQQAAETEAARLRTEEPQAVSVRHYQDGLALAYRRCADELAAHLHAPEGGLTDEQRTVHTCATESAPCIPCAFTVGAPEGERRELMLLHGRIETVIRSLNLCGTIYLGLGHVTTGGIVTLLHAVAAALPRAPAPKTETE